MDISELYTSWGIRLIDPEEKRFAPMEECPECKQKFTCLGIMKLHICPKLEMETYKPGNFETNYYKGGAAAEEMQGLKFSKPQIKPKGIFCPNCQEGFTESTELISHFLTAHSDNNNKSKPLPISNFSRVEEESIEAFDQWFLCMDDYEEPQVYDTEAIENNWISEKKMLEGDINDTLMNSREITFPRKRGRPCKDASLFVDRSMKPKSDIAAIFDSLASKSALMKKKK
ncbi:unnamed protein product [Blepharisma stoltei]|uniref:C2H2-type domain-containing protein n=1 Tax=Blepharisma stoltei TaxID=1481888 RepID=A0AAU9K0W3_9CILI|nr:unnamed protein product [Blepharisma stoltei]